MSENEIKHSKSVYLDRKNLHKEKILKNLRGNKEKTTNIIDDYIIKETIGKGTFSTVKLGENIKTKEKVAIKILNKEKIKAKEDLERIKREIKILSMMDHPNIIKTYHISENEKNYYIIMEYCNGGELFNYIVKKEKLEENEASMFFYQLINALEYIHSKGIAHRDLKPENLLLVENNTIIKIIDFGLSNYFNGEKQLETPCGSPSYASPEIIKGDAYNGFCIDVWASGIILFAMLCGYLPFDDDEEEEEEDEKEEESEEESSEESNSDEDDINSNKSKSDKNGNDSEDSDENEVLFQKILEGKLDYPSHLSEDSIDLMKKILVVDPKKRIEIKDIKKHKFFLLGEKNFLLNQKNIIQKDIPQKSSKDENINEKNNINNNIEKDKINKENINDSNKNISLNNNNKSSEIKNIKSINISKKVVEEYKNKENNIIKNKDKEKREIKDDMEEYEKKLFENYLKNVITIKKKNSFINKRKKQSAKKQLINLNKRPKNLYPLKTINNVIPAHSIFNKNLKKFGKTKNNYTLNEIILDFNPNNVESQKQIVNTTSRKYNSIDNNTNIFKNKISITKIKPVIRKNKFDFPLNYNKKYDNLFNQNENSKSLNKDKTHLCTINIPEITPARRNNTENKLLYITSGNYKKIDDNKRNMFYLRHPKLKSIEYNNDISRIKTNKPVLPIIKTNAFRIFNNKSIANKESSILTPSLNLKPEEIQKVIRKKIIFNKHQKDFSSLVNHTNHLLNNEFRYKLFYPKFNVSTLKGIY